MTVDPTTGAVTLGTPHVFRTPWFTQTDFNLVQSWKVNKQNEAQELAFEFNVLNLLNQHAVTNYYGGMNSTWNSFSHTSGRTRTLQRSGYLSGVRDRATTYSS